MFFAGLTAALAALDLYLKKVIEDQEDKDFPRELKGTKGKIMLYKNHNPGFSFGVLKDRPELVFAIPLMIASALAGILCWLLPRKGFLVEKLAISMTLGGGISNLYDRLTRHYVVDYFSIQWKQLKKVVFNLGDIFIFAGIGLLFLSETIQSIRDGAKK